ncbi:EAL domain-containing protein [Paramagnetospirillum marisnigri]|uniref:EAL domain-containing protein n=1 Tax=Paramagnetospirillum marisnigri TaxID=1285242 RepID=UPI00155FC551|nr:EAL domain-containing protein [Paramagnetospirillum marisnigri]
MIEFQQALRFCESEQIQRPGAIQPLGVLLALDDALVVRHASCNVFSMFGQTAEGVLGRPFADLVGTRQAEGVRELIGLEDWRRTAITSFTLEQGGLQTVRDAQVSRHQDFWLVEIEWDSHPGEDLFHNLFIPIRDALWLLDSESDLLRYTQQVVHQVRLLTGYDRVMMYQFDTNWDGVVIAESKVDGVDSYLGNRFPASDIPAQARDLYTRNLVRLIADVDSEPVAVEPMLIPATGEPLDMTYSALRALSPVHLEYLRNMQVRATLTISLIQNSRLWGLIACHHTTPKYIPLRVRELDEFIGNTVSLKLSNLEHADKAHFLDNIRRLLDNLMEEIRDKRNVPAVLDHYQRDLLSLVRASGAIIVVEGQRFHFGETPSNDQMGCLEGWLKTQPPAAVFHTNTLSMEYPLAGGFGSGINGLMMAPLNHHLDSYIIWFRPGILRTIKWAGNPDKSVRRENGHLRISPRDSFKTWIETVKDNAQPWSPVEVDAAKALSLSMIEVLTHRALESSEENYRRLAEYSTDMIAQIDHSGAFSYVSPASEALLGYSPDRMVGRSIDSFIFAEDQATLRRTLARLDNGGPAGTVLLRMHNINGGAVWMECTLKPMRARDGMQSVVINARDVTQRHSYQLAIEDLHRRNTKLLDAATEGLIGVGKDMRITFANDRAGQILCCLPSALSGTPLRNHIGDHPLLGTLERGEALHNNTDHFIRSDGRSISVRAVCTPTPDGGLLVFSENIGSQVSDDHLRTTTTVFEQTNEAVMVTDRNSCIITVNRAFTRATGFTAEEVLGQTPKILKSGVHTPHFYESLWTALNEKQYWAGEIWNRRKNGEIYPQWGSITAIVDDAGEVLNYVAVFSDVSKAKQAEERLFFLANHDTLTSLPNRTRFIEHLSNAIDRARRNRERLAIAFIDLDRFKIVNDTLGHTAGDQYLKVVASRISAVSRQQEMLARWGGDEFVLLLEQVGDHSAVAEAIQRMLTCISQPVDIDGHELTPTVSVGISLFPDDADNVSDLVKAADTAMYRTKERGRNGFEFFTQGLSDDIQRKFEIVTELRRALRDDQLVLHYQPQFDATSGLTVGVEALVRWDHPERGLLFPVDFIPLAEDLGLIGEVGEWVLGEACRQMAEWVQTGVQVPRVAVNVAPAQLKSNLPELVRRKLAEFSLSPCHLELEITEGALERGQQVLPILVELRELGVALSIDDFGTGYSSLAHLKNFPITTLKIDKSFIDGVPANSQDIAIITAILALGGSLALEVVAEGVETMEQFDFLRTMGKVCIQGFVHSRPVAANRISQALAQSKK